jgi:hypothetical protein
VGTDSRVEAGDERRGAMMSIEQRVEYLLRAALRAERDGDHRVARSLRRMADDILPLNRARSMAVASGSFG